MKNFCFLTVILLSAGLICCGCSRSEDNSAKSDKEIMQGVWVGDAVGLDNQFKLTVDGNNFELEATDADLRYKGTFTLNEQTSPKEADFLMDDSNIEAYIGCTAKSIYKIEDDTLIVAGNEPGVETRPSIFEPSDLTQVFTLNRK